MPAIPRNKSSLPTPTVESDPELAKANAIKRAKKRAESPEGKLKAKVAKRKTQAAQAQAEVAMRPPLSPPS